MENEELNKIRVTYFKKLWYDFKLETKFPEEAEIQTFQEFIDDPEFQYGQFQYGSTLLYYDTEAGKLLTLEELFEDFLTMHRCLKTFQAILANYENESNIIIK